MSTLGERIRYAREEKGLLQNDLAKLIGVKSSGVISNWEKYQKVEETDSNLNAAHAIDNSSAEDKF